MFQSWLYIVLLLPVFYYGNRLLRVGSRPRGWPPGPPTVPIFGNILQMPTRDPQKQFQKWSQEYGPVYSLILGTKTWIILSTDVGVKDLLDKKSNIYSDRLDMYIGQTLCSGDSRFLLMQYGPKWRMYRKIMHNLLNVAAARAFVPYQILENKQMLYDMLNQPKDFLDHVRRYSNSLTTSMVYGWRSPTFDKPEVKQLFDGFDQFVQINQSPPALLLDAFPVLRNLPDSFLPVRKKANHLHRLERALYLGHWLTSKEATKSNPTTNSLCASLAKIQAQEHFPDVEAAYVAGSILEAGSDTTASTLYGFIQAMVVFPAVQRKAQEEIDRVCGDERLPTMDDEPNLPYIRACVKETMRWMPAAPTSFPHAVTQDDEYMGYKIPKGAGVVMNTYAIHMDPNRYPEPRQFQPERFVDDNQTAAEAAANPDVSQRDHFTFGAGRRVCQGTHVAERTLFLAMARLLWGFDFRLKSDGEGSQVDIDTEAMTQGFVVRPVDFEAQIQVRSGTRKEVIENEWECAKVDLDGVGQLKREL